MRLKEIISEKYTKSQGQDIISLVASYFEWRSGIMQAVKDTMVRWDNEWKAEIAEYRDEVNSWKTAKKEAEDGFNEPKPIKPVRHANDSLEDRIVRIDDHGVGIIFLRDNDDAVVICGRESSIATGYNCYSSDLNVISFSGGPRSFLMSKKFGILFHEWWHSTQTGISSDSGQLPHNLRIQEIDAVIATALAPFVSKLRKTQPGRGAVNFMKGAGFKDDYGHFVRKFLPKQLTFIKSLMNYPGGPGWEYTEDVHRSTSVHKGFFSYLRAYYRDEYTPHMNIPDGYWVSDANDRERGT